VLVPLLDDVTVVGTYLCLFRSSMTSLGCVNCAFERLLKTILTIKFLATFLSCVN